MNIGQVTIGTRWKKLDEVSNYSYELNSSYTIQNKGVEALQVCEASSIPQDDRVGFIVYSGQTIGYTKTKAEEYLWVRAFVDNAQFNVSEGM